MQVNSEYLLIFDYPENRDKTISNFGLKLLLLLFLFYAYTQQTEFFGQSIFIFLITIIILQTVIELRTFYAYDQIGLLNDALLLLKNSSIKSKTPFKNLAFVVKNNPIDISNNITIDFYEQDTKQHLFNLKKNDLSEEVFYKFIEELAKISGRDSKEFLTSSENQLLSFMPQYMDEQTMQGEFIKYTKQSFFTKYNFLIIIFTIVTILMTLYFLNH